MFAYTLRHTFCRSSRIPQLINLHQRQQQTTHVAQQLKRSAQKLATTNCQLRDYEKEAKQYAIQQQNCNINLPF